MTELPTTRRKRSPRLLRIALLLILILVIIGYPIISLLGYNTLSLVSAGEREKNYPIGAYEDVRFPSRGQGYSVYAYYLPGKPSYPALISVHGWKGTRHDPYDLDRVQAFRDLGYTVLAVDLSDSRGDTVGNGRISMGYEERYDVLGGFDYLLTRGFKADQIGLVGISMGGATVLLAGGLEPGIRAIWSDSPFGRPDTVASEQAETYGFPRLIVPGGMIWGVLITGHAMWEASALDQGIALASNDQRVYLTHCENDGFVFYHHSQDILAAYKAAGVQVTLWPTTNCPKREGSAFVHASGFIPYRDEYLKRLDTFFTNSLSKPG